ncbi:MAG TPA: toluene-4-monooxygenase system B family protein [Polyangiaceae bacterium]|jgi:hypothetical protein|nr:toluene-4-monooxygenase system B family protein [Polyangiaceae bacterium]
MIPLYGFLRGDTLGLLILAAEDETVAELGHKLAQAARIRVKTTGPLQVIYRGRTLDPTARLREIGIGPLERFDAEEAP